MKYVHGIVVVNRPDLLERAVQSIQPLWPSAFILDNSPDSAIGKSRTWPIQVIRPSVPLTCAQSMNFLHRTAKEQGAGIWGYQHNDAWIKRLELDKYRLWLRKLGNSADRWCTLFTGYDALSAYSVAAVDSVGLWDTNFPNPNYHIDNDWFYRARQAGYETIHSGIRIHHEGSATINADPDIKYINDVRIPMNQAYYLAKWGGPPHHEEFTTPWNKITEP